MLTERLATEVLVVGFLDPAGDHRLVQKTVGVLEVQESGQEPTRGLRLAGMGGEEPCPFLLEERPVHVRLQSDRFVAHVDHVGEAQQQKIVLFGDARLRLHGTSGIAVFWSEL